MVSLPEAGPAGCVACTPRWAMKPIRAVHVWAALALIAACHLDQLVSGSGGSGGGGGGPPPPPTSGNLKVTTSTTGSNLDPDGYTVTVDGTSSRPITINNSTGVTFTGLAAGSHDVVLSGVAANCSVSGGATQTATVTASQTATLAFSVTCSAMGTAAIPLPLLSAGYICARLAPSTFNSACA